MEREAQRLFFSSATLDELSSEAKAKALDYLPEATSPIDDLFGGGDLPFGDPVQKFCSSVARWRALDKDEATSEVDSESASRCCASDLKASVLRRLQKDHHRHKEVERQYNLMQVREGAELRGHSSREALIEYPAKLIRNSQGNNYLFLPRLENIFTFCTKNFCSFSSFNVVYL